MPEKLSFGGWLRRQRRTLDLTRQALADQVGCAEITLRRIEGETLKPSKELAGIILKKVGIPAAELPQWISFARGLSGIPLQSNSSSKKTATNLPTPITSFIGRGKEQSDVIRLTMVHRLVTLTGAGGVGKTRLALKVADQIFEAYPDGVFFVELAPVFDPLLVPRTTAIAIGLRDEPQRPIVDMLSDYLREKQILIILDNCEHLLDATAHLADTLLKRCPDLKILATSRELLGIMGETVYPVLSLELPDVGQLLKNIRDYESVRLFEERAQLARIDFSMTLENVSSVAEICRRLDGIPLAIELAAARINTLSTEQIAMRLRESFSLLTTGNRTALPRHQTLRAAIDWSYDLLTLEEQTLFRRVSVFVNGWTLEATEAVCSDGTIKSETVLNLLTQLINKSLIIAQVMVGGTRYRLLETIREYGLEKLSSGGEDNQIRIRHLECFVQLAERAKERLLLSDQEITLRELDAEYGNLHSSLEWAMESDPVRALQLSADMGGFWETRGYIREGRVAIEKAMGKALTASNELRARGSYWASVFTFREGDYAKAKATIEEALALFRSVGDQYGEVDSLILLANIFMIGSLADPSRGAEIARRAFIMAKSLGDIKRKADALYILAWDGRDFKRSFFYWKEAIKLYRQIGHQIRLAHSLSRYSLFLLLDGQLDAAQECIDEANSLFQKLNIKGRRGLLQGLGQIALLHGNYDQARTYFQEDAEISNKIGDRLDYLRAKSRLAIAELLAGNITEARQIFTETVQDYQKDGNRVGIVFTLEGISSLYVKIGKSDVAAQLIGWANTIREKIKDSRPTLEQADVDKTIAACIVAMGDVAYANAYDKGSKLTMDQAVSLAIEEG